MAGGRGTRLKVLTRDRCKPAVDILGRYKIFDFVATNIADTGIYATIVATQFDSESLSAHIGDGKAWGFDGASKKIEIVDPGKEGLTFEGTADSVRKSASRIDRYNPRVILVLGSDHVYSMDYTDVVRYHETNNADITIMTNVIPDSKVSDFGIVKIDKSGRIIDFAEKPTDREVIESFRLTPEMKKRLDIDNPELNFLASMGNYVFFWDRLKRFLDSPGADFGKDIIPTIGETSSALYAYVFHGYWRDVGRLRDYFECNMDFTNGKSPVAPLEDHIRTNGKYPPSAKVDEDSYVENTILGFGDEIRRLSIIRDSVLGNRVTVEERCILEHCILLGSDKNGGYCDPQAEGCYSTRIGEGSKLSHVIMGKNVWIGKDVNINPHNGTPEQRKKILQGIGLRPYKENGKDTAEGDFCIERDSGILVVGGQCEADPEKPILPDGLRC
jgi:glucose-1-phosphate adenylyltransferase